jgi:hypothetical protein
MYFAGMNTLHSWIKAHPGINVLAFERHSDKSFGFGDWEEVCGFCLASHYFEEEPPDYCHFCKAPLRNTHVISDLPEVKKQIYDFPWQFNEPSNPRKKLLFIVRNGNTD